MSTLYRLARIESAEQAEALPIGTLAVSSEVYDDGTVMHWAAVKVSDVWARTDVGDGLPMIDDAAMVDVDIPWSALVPIVAREESMGAAYWPGPFGKRTQRILTRLVTPWEESR